MGAPPKTIRHSKHYINCKDKNSLTFCSVNLTNWLSLLYHEMFHILSKFVVCLKLVSFGNSIYSALLAGLRLNIYLGRKWRNAILTNLFSKLLVSLSYLDYSFNFLLSINPIKNIQQDSHKWYLPAGWNKNWNKVFFKVFFLSRD